MNGVCPLFICSSVAPPGKQKLQARTELAAIIYGGQESHIHAHLITPVTSEIEAYAEEMVLVAAIVVHRAQSVAGIDLLVLKTDAEIERKAADVEIVVEHKTVTQVESGKTLQAGTELGREGTYTGLDADLVPVAPVVVVQGILYYTFQGQVLVDAVLRTRTQFPLGTNSRFYGP